ncbi:MAG TPA: hypothetical protein VFQ85_10745 [Mycobacteriales bacterium]|jgi:hypothetical protein|nr:hypothetical protein [Mycobacteriales bacterium]
MKSYPSWDQVRADLGDKVVAAFVEAVALTRADLTLYREAFPGWVARHSERGLANWIHDAFWAHAAAILDGVPGVTLVDREPRREIGIGYSYRIRLKRHHLDGHVATYPTEGALEFLAQPAQETFDGLSETHLIAGYEWDEDTRAIGDALISLRDGSVIIWKEPLVDDEEDGGVVAVPSVRGPVPPVISDPAAAEQERADLS